MKLINYVEKGWRRRKISKLYFFIKKQKIHGHEDKHRLIPHDGICFLVAATARMVVLLPTYQRSAVKERVISLFRVQRVYGFRSSHIHYARW